MMVTVRFLILFSTLLYGQVYTPAVELTDKDFDSTLTGKRAMVMLYSPNCGHCQRLKPTYDLLSEQKSIKESGVIIAKVDCTDKGKTICSRYGVSGFPTLKFISRVDGPETTEDYEGSRGLDDLVAFVQENSRPLIQELKALVEAKDFIKSITKPVVVCFSKDSKSKLFSKLLSLVPANRKKYLFGFTHSSDMTQGLNQSMETVVLYRQQQYKSPLEPSFLTETSEKKLDKFLVDNFHSLVEIRNHKNEHEFATPLVVAYAPIDYALQKSAFKRLRNTVFRFASVNSDIKFAISLARDYQPFLSEFAPKGKDRDVFLVAYDKEDKKYVCKKSVPYDDVKQLAKVLEQFVVDFKDGGKLEEHIKSEPVPTEDDGHVKVVVAKTFEQIVLDSDKDVLVEFYAPWCGHCQKLAPIYRKLAETLKDETHLVIAKMDATANEVHKDFLVQGFPTIYLSKAGDKTHPIAFSGKRTVSDMVAWLKQHVKNPIAYSGPVPEPKEDEL